MNARWTKTISNADVKNLARDLGWSEHKVIEETEKLAAQQEDYIHKNIENIKVMRDRWLHQDYGVHDSPHMNERDRAWMLSGLRALEAIDELESLLDSMPISPTKVKFAEIAHAIFVGGINLGLFGWRPDHLNREAIDKHLSKSRQIREDQFKPEILKRENLLQESGLDLTVLAKSRKQADAAKITFDRICVDNAVSPVSGKQTQRDAKNLLIRQLSQNRDKL